MQMFIVKCGLTTNFSLQIVKETSQTSMEGWTWASDKIRTKTLRRKPSKTVDWLKIKWLNKKNAKTVEFFFQYISYQTWNFDHPPKNLCNFTGIRLFSGTAWLNSGIACAGCGAALSDFWAGREVAGVPMLWTCISFLNCLVAHQWV